MIPNLNASQKNSTYFTQFKDRATFRRRVWYWPMRSTRGADGRVILHPFLNVLPDFDGRLSQASKNAKRDVAFRFAQEQLEDAGVRSGAPPFAIVASNVMDVSVGR